MACGHLVTEELFAITEGERTPAAGAGLGRAVDPSFMLFEVLRQAERRVALGALDQRRPVFAHVLRQVLLPLVGAGAFRAAPGMRCLVRFHVLCVPGKEEGQTLVTSLIK